MDPKCTHSLVAKLKYRLHNQDHDNDRFLSQ